MGDAEIGSSGSRVRTVQDWFARRADTSMGRLGLQWFRSYFEASRNSGCAATVYSCLSVLPTALVVIAFFHLSTTDENAFANRLVTHLKLNGSTASLVRDAFGSTSTNALAATLTVVVGFLIWGIGIGQIYRDVYARAWDLEVGSAVDQLLFAVFFFVVSGAIALAVVSSAQLHDAGWLALLPFWLIGSTAFWLWAPRFLLHGKVALRALLPGALLGSVVLGGAAATSPLFLGAPLNANGKAFGSFGVVMTLVAYVFILVTMSMVCAVFSPVWAHWRQSENDRREVQPRAITHGEPDVPVEPVEGVEGR